ncbi:unnamed protein product [Brassica rapa]|uniref:Uncharacterized protein n=2 Tax=Brassica TaxID=3705 RepID=A0A8D9I6Y6_BRACM|nr:unnamed protein product [Brassica napus]CAG7911387.1 unnamed protein product [Brassica rapa]
MKNANFIFLIILEGTRKNITPRQVKANTIKGPIKPKQQLHNFKLLAVNS